MPISTLDPSALARLTAGEIASLALSADQSARLARERGRLEDAREHEREADALCAIYRQR
jgi:hypothetical protein